MKRMLAMMLTLLLMLSIHMGALAAEPNEIIWLDENGNVTTLEAAAVTICTPQYGQVQVIVPVKCFFETDESTASFTIYPAAMNVTFKYYVAADKAGKLVGGYGVTEDGYPMLEALPVDWPLDVSFALETVPVVNIVAGQGDAYAVDIRGGSFQLTWNSELHYDRSGSLLSVKSTTESRAFSFHAEGK